MEFLTPQLTVPQRPRVTRRRTNFVSFRVSPDGVLLIVCEVMEVMSSVLARSSDDSVLDAEALVTALFNTEAVRLVHLARFFVDDRTAAEDLVQEGFIRLARSAHRIQDPSRAAAYLRSIVINLARDHNRRGLVSLRHRPPADVDERSAEDHATRREDQRQVIAALRSLPRRQRDCVALRYYLELPIAETLGLSPNSVKTHLQRGLRTLALELEGIR